MSDESNIITPDSNGLPFHQLSEAGLLWLINRVVFHPRGFALALHTTSNGTVTGWSLLGDGTEPWTFKNEDDDTHFSKAEATLLKARSSSKEKEA